VEILNDAQKQAQVALDEVSIKDPFEEEKKKNASMA